MATTYAQTLDDKPIHSSSDATTTTLPQTPTISQASVRVVETSMKAFAVRLSPEMDIKEELERIIKNHNITAAAVITCVGSLRHAVIRCANKPTGIELQGPLEIVSLTGTLGQDGSHLHIAVSDSTGMTIGGHVMTGCRVFTTAEIVLGILTDAIFTRELDAASGYKELVITPATGSKYR